jgi:integrase
VKRSFIFACFTGLRLGDVIDLEYSNIQDGEIRVKQGKTGSQVSIPVTETITRLLREAETLNHSEKVFDMPSKTTANATLKAWVAVAGINKKVSFHTSRHTFATLMVYYSRDIFTASKLLGHSDVKITQVYTKLIDDAKITAMNSIPELRKKG